MFDADPWFTRRRVFGALLAIAVLALVLRLFGLGGRIAHWDEARVAYWTLRYHDLGVFEYHPVVHGPFLFHVNETIFGLFGASDVTMRLIVAVIAGISPLAVWLYREHLTSIEMVVMAGLLMINPVLLYYGRFARNDVILAVAMLFAFGFLLRAYDTRKTVYLYPMMIALALGFAMKENALLYLMCWGGAAVAVIGHRIGYEHIIRTYTDRTPRSWNVRHTWRQWLPDNPRLVARDGLLSLGAGLAILVYFYAPRGTDEPAPADLLTEPWQLPALIEASLIEGARRLYNHWISGGRGPDYFDSLWFYIDVIAAGALIVVIFAVVGVIYDHWRDEGPRWLLIFALAWGLLSVGGYPYAGTINAPWLVAHMVVPLTIPAAVGLGMLIEDVVVGVDQSDLIQAGGAGLILLAAVGLILMPAYGLVYEDPTGGDNELVQFAQPGGDWNDTIERMHDLIDHNEDGPDVLYVGDQFYTDDRDGERYKQAGAGWYDRLPLPWYTEQVGGVTVSEQSISEIITVIEEDEPPVVIVGADDTGFVEERLEGYEVREHELRRGAFDIHIYLDLDRLDNE